MSITVIPVCPGFPLFPYPIQIIDEDRKPVPIADATFRMQIRESRLSDVVLVELSSENGLIDITNANQGMIVIEMSADDTAKIPRGGVFDLELTLNGIPTPGVLDGLVSSRLPVTRPISPPAPPP